MKIRIFGQRNILGGGIHYSNFSKILKNYSGLSLVVEEYLPSDEVQIADAIAQSNSSDINIWFYPTQYIGKIKGRNVVWAIFESNILPDSYLNFFRCADLVWTPSNWGRATLIKNGIDPTRIDVVPEGIDPCTFHPFRKQRRRIGDNIFRFLAVGKYEERKGYTQLFEAFNARFRNNSSIELLIKGDYFVDFDNRKKGLIKAIQAINASNIKIISGQLQDSQMHHLYSIADAFVFPSRAEGWGLPLIEAIACGLPSLAINYSGQTEYLEKIENLYASVNFNMVPLDNEFRNYWDLGDLDHGVWAEADTTDLAEKMVDIYENRITWAEKGYQASNIIRSTYNWQKSVDVALISLCKKFKIDFDI